ncbi:MAG: response regulator [Lachnospiraceae bacterium]|nr:response regulator [Lachnospiraceae bacterium]
MGNDTTGAQAARIMIVDDLETNRFILRNIIMDMGYQPVLAENGMQAVKLLPHCNPELILLDISMPEMDGYEFCRIIKGNPDLRNIPIVFISAFDDPQDVVKGFAMGGEDYITKPFIPEVVKSRVGVHLRLHEATRNLQEINRRLQVSVAEQVRQMEREKKTMLYALANIARENSSYDAAHMERVSYNCRILTQAMQFSPRYEQYISDSFIDTIEIAAPLSDIGNVAIPMEILQKKTRLTPEEIKVMQTHTTVGAKILRDISMTGDYNDFLKQAIDIAHYHHENWDGTGYPDGKKENEIPLSAQIVSMISTYCALTEERAYRSAFSREEALGIMQNEAGTRFNAELLEICKKISRQLH